MNLLRESLGEFDILLLCFNIEELTASVPKSHMFHEEGSFSPAWLQLKSPVIMVLEVSVSYAKFNEISILFCTSLIEFGALRKQIIAIFLDFIYLKIIFYIIFSAARCLTLLLT